MAKHSCETNFYPIVLIYIHLLAPLNPHYDSFLPSSPLNKTLYVRDATEPSLSVFPGPDSTKGAIFWPPLRKAPWQFSGCPDCFFHCCNQWPAGSTGLRRGWWGAIWSNGQTSFDHFPSYKPPLKSGIRQPSIDYWMFFILFLCMVNNAW